ncbi:MAG: hypothetical protein GY754_24345 [bacterium]|nr:hypothetical protein [bacterium]
MKKLLTSFFVFIAVFLISQGALMAAGEERPVSAGNVVLAVGNLCTFQKGTGDLYRNGNSYVGVSPSTVLEAHFLVVKGLALGTSFFIGQETQTDDYGDTLELFAWSIGPSIYYYIDFGENLIPYLGVKFVYGKQELDPYSVTTYSYGGMAGLNYMLLDSLGIYLQYCFTKDLYVAKRPVSFWSGSYDAEVEVHGNLHKIDLGFRVFF